jgi:cytochrome c-type biogenesis protein CcmF
MDKFNDGYTLPGSLGHFFVLLAFVTALVATYSYYKSTVVVVFAEKLAWRKLARISFYVQFFSIISIVVCLYYILYNHQYQYKFAYKHSDNSLPVKYLFSCFWEGQEGSFLLWFFWHSVLGLFVMNSAKQWEAPVMAILSFVQIFLGAFLLGIYFGDFHIGSSPFVLLRNSDMGIGPIFQRANYLEFIKDGNGLNKTLQDPWMVIHPPTLFFGFASCTIPMAFAVAALWRKDYAGWIKPCLPWTILASSVLGVGILMGAKWAYQSLSFGGYWAWDPVENASLVPWLILIAGMHTKLIYKHTGYSLRATFLFLILTFIFIIYSTCLTRTGILGETSVHAFTGGGLQMQIWLLMVFLCVAPIVLLIIHYKKIPTIVKEEATWSREFWMFIGSLVFFLSAMFIIAATSLPVVNKLFGLHAALGENSQAIYNKVHIPIIIIIAFIIAITQYLKYKNTSKEFILKKLAIPVIVSIVIAIAFLATDGITYNKQGDVFKWLIALALAASIFTVIANGMYITQVVKNKVTNWGSSLGHLGFGLLLVGILISASNQKILSKSMPAVNVFNAESKEDPRENLLVFKSTPTTMDKYIVEYKSNEKDKISKDKLRYKVTFKDTIKKEVFELEPTAFLNVMAGGKKQIQPNPDFKNYWNKDVFLYITSLINPEELEKPIDYEQKTMKIGDTVGLRNGFFILKNSIPLSGSTFTKNNDLGFKAQLEITSSLGKKDTFYTSYIVKNNVPQLKVDSFKASNLYFRIDGVGENNKLLLSVKDNNPLSDYIAIKVLEFPHIKLMWIGIIIMSIGFMLSMVRRIKQLKEKQ